MKFDKVEKIHYLLLLKKTTYNGVSSVGEHILKLVKYYSKLNSMKIDLRDKFLILCALK